MQPFSKDPSCIKEFSSVKDQIIVRKVQVQEDVRVASMLWMKLLTSDQTRRNLSWPVAPPAIGFSCTH